MGRTATKEGRHGRSRASFGVGDAYRRSSTRAGNAAKDRSCFGLPVCNMASRHLDRHNAGRTGRGVSGVSGDVLGRSGSRLSVPIRGGDALRSWSGASMQHLRKDQRHGWRRDAAMVSKRTISVRKRERTLLVLRPHPRIGEGA